MKKIKQFIKDVIKYIKLRNQAVEDEEKFKKVTKEIKMNEEWISIKELYELMNDIENKYENSNK